MDRHLKKKGSYTIELALLTPVIIAVLLFILFSSYYMHDRVIIEKTCYISALRAALWVKEDEREAIAEECFEKEIKGRLLGIWNIEKSFEPEKEYVKGNVNAVMEMKEGLLKKILSDKLFSFKTECISFTANETKYLRTYKKGK